MVLWNEEQTGWRKTRIEIENYEKNTNYRGK